MIHTAEKFSTGGCALPNLDETDHYTSNGALWAPSQPFHTHLVSIYLVQSYSPILPTKNFHLPKKSLDFDNVTFGTPYDTTSSDKRIFGSDGNTTMLSFVNHPVDPMKRFANSPDIFASTCADLFARMLHTVPSGVQLTDVILPLPVKPSNIEVIVDGDTLQLWGQLRVRTGNATLTFYGLSFSTGGKYSAAWYVRNTTEFSVLYLDAIAGVKSLSFIVDGELQDQNGLGFAIQDGFMFATVNPTRVYLEQTTTDSVERIAVVEIDISPPSQPVALNSAYSLWSINVTSPTAPYGIGVEIQGVKYSSTEAHSFIPRCGGGSYPWYEEHLLNFSTPHGRVLNLLEHAFGVRLQNDGTENSDNSSNSNPVAAPPYCQGSHDAGVAVIVPKKSIC
ncbi:hypothetical protein C8R45DRAFT_1193912 [Mycena sanguinolenta]|nr:hypothetical protein C8R45DRAFT_1193912 [Mycena sanguinolenta]